MDQIIKQTIKAQQPSRSEREKIKEERAKSLKMTSRNPGQPWLHPQKPLGPSSKEKATRYETAKTAAIKTMEHDKATDKMVACSEKENRAPLKRENNTGRTLVVLLGNARGGMSTWTSLKRQVMQVFDADLALLGDADP